MPDLEEQLTGLGSELEWPPTPAFHLPLRADVVTFGRRPESPFRQNRWALAAAAVLLIVVTLLTYTPSRDAIAGWLDVHTNIHLVPHPPTPSPLPPGPLGERLNLGDRTTLDGAQTAVTWKVHVPSSLGQPDAVFLKRPPSGPSGGEVTLVYAQRPDIKPTALTGVSVLVTEARGAVNETFFGKMLGPDSTVEDVSVGGHKGYWISGTPHDFAFTDANGNFYTETMRLATNTLVFDDNGTVVRIEGDMTKAQALQIATSLL
jgi:hypothetical protein